MKSIEMGEGREGGSVGTVRGRRSYKTPDFQPPKLEKRRKGGRKEGENDKFYARSHKKEISSSLSLFPTEKRDTAAASLFFLKVNKNLRLWGP